MLRFLFCLPLLCGAGRSAAQQEAEESIQYAEQYLDGRTQDLNKYLGRSGKIQQRLLRKLKRKEDKYARQLAVKDSALYRAYTQQGLSYDSIATLSKDTANLNRLAKKKNTLVDSLKGVQSFIQNQSSKLNGAAALAGKAGISTDELNQLQQKLNVQQSIDELIQQRTRNLEGLAGGQNIGGLQNIQKNVFYAQEKIKAWKKVADDPDETEQKALEFLQGTEGFDGYLKGNKDAFGGLGNQASAEDLQRMGFQTKSQVNQLLADKLGNNLGAVQQQMAAQVQDYSEKLSSITGKVKEAQSSLSEAKQTLSEAKGAKEQLKHIQKPAFKKNPERGKPFWQRLSPSYNFQTNRATTDGLRPAMLELAAAIAFKHTPRLSYGIGLGLSTGLGQNWQHIRLSYEGISTRVFADWKWQYGFSLQAGYERIFRPANRTYLPEQQSNNPGTAPVKTENIFKEAFGGQQQAAYIGIMKRYKISSKWNGTFLLGYNFLWQHEGLRSPFLLRFGATK
nr:hypothetical protein [Pedobacter sp. ASV19]